MRLSFSKYLGKQLRQLKKETWTQEEKDSCVNQSGMKKHPPLIFVILADYFLLMSRCFKSLNFK